MGASVTRRESLVAAGAAGLALTYLAPVGDRLAGPIGTTLLVTDPADPAGRFMTDALARTGLPAIAIGWGNMVGQANFPAVASRFDQLLVFLPSATCFVVSAMFGEQGFVPVLRLARGVAGQQPVAQGQPEWVALAARAACAVGDWSQLCRDVSGIATNAHAPSGPAGRTPAGAAADHFELRLLRAAGRA